MENIVRNVRDIDSADREVLEHVVGRELLENQQIIISVVNLDMAATPPDAARQPVGGLPDWCNVYEGLTVDEIDEIEKSIVRSTTSRSFD
ncbi:MAG: hypothetical protein WD847_03325 [Pirellulales bacterium]